MALLWQNYRRDDTERRGAPPSCGGTDNGHPERCPPKPMRSRDPMGCGERSCRAVHRKGAAAVVGSCSTKWSSGMSSYICLTDISL